MLTVLPKAVPTNGVSEIGPGGSGPVTSKRKLPLASATVLPIIVEDPSLISTKAPGAAKPIIVGVVSVVSPLNGTEIPNTLKNQLTVLPTVFSIQLKQLIGLVLAV